MRIVYAMCIGFVLDMIFGDPCRTFHPIRILGRLIGRLEERFYHSFSGLSERAGRRIGGFCMALSVLFLTTVTLLCLRYMSYQICFASGVLFDGSIFFFCIAPKSLYRESMAVYQALQDKGLDDARYRLSWIVGRDTQALPEEGVIRAAVETVAENTSDGVTAPILYMALGGPILCMLYKAVNTMDSMVGYRNGKYRDFGAFAARLDDAANFIPARLTAAFMLLGVWLLRLAEGNEKYDAGNAWRIYLRDRGKHASPNSAQTESVCAGALKVRLAGPAYYFGKKVEKPFIGDDLRKIERGDIKKANLMMLVTSFLIAIAVIELRVVLCLK